MNDLTLARLYRRGTDSGVMTLDADALTALAEDDHGDRRDSRDVGVVADSSPDSDIVRLLRALRPASATLAGNLRNCHVAPHRHGRAFRRIAGGSSRADTSHYTHWSAVAACLLAIVGVWAVAHRPSSQSLAPLNNPVISAAASHHGDEIFRWGSQSLAKGETPAVSTNDRVFDSSFTTGG